MDEKIIGYRILDFGCGSGYLSNLLAKINLDIHSVDVVDYNKSLHPRVVYKKLPYLYHRLPYQNRFFDTVIISFVLHHINFNRLINVLKEIKRISKKIIFEEDIYDLAQENTKNKIYRLLINKFNTLSEKNRKNVLIFLDYYANSLRLGYSNIQYPFVFLSNKKWIKLLYSLGFSIIKNIIKSFQKEKLHWNSQCIILAKS